jgi:hypothetical protein
MVHEVKGILEDLQKDGFTKGDFMGQNRLLSLILEAAEGILCKYW